jgi:DNA-binding beta-propeller fold protein YncE
MKFLIASLVCVLVIVSCPAALVAQGWDFKGPFGVAVNSRDIVYVAEIGNKRVSKFTTDGKWLGVIDHIEGYGALAGPFDVCIGPNDSIYITDTLGHRVLVLDAQENLRFVLGTPDKGAGPGQFAEPHFVTVNQGGEIFVADTFNARIQKFTPDGEWIKAWGAVGEGPGQFLIKGYLARIDVDNRGFVYVREFDGGRIQKYTEDGEYVATFSRRGGGDGELDEGYGLAVIDGKLFCPDTFASRVQVFSLDGELLDIWAPGEGNDGEHFNHPVGIAATASGDLIVTDWKNNRVLRLNPRGEFLDTWGVSMDSVLAWRAPEWVARPPGRPIELAVYAGIDDNTLEAAHRAGVDVIYPSLNDQYTDWDIRAQVEKAGALGIQIHPSIACLIFGQGQSGNSGVFSERPELCMWKKGAAEPMATILSWSHPGARAYRVGRIAERTRANGLDGIMLDYIRYLGTDYGYDPLAVQGFFEKFKVNPLALPQDDPRWMQYRADFVTDFIAELRHELATTVPDRHIEVSVYLSGDDPSPDAYLKQSLQDWRAWASMGIVDTLNVAWYTRDMDQIYTAVRRVREAVPDRVRINSFIACYGGNLNTPELLRKGFEASIAGGADRVTVYRGDTIRELDLWGAIEEIGRDVKDPAYPPEHLR